MLKTINTRYLIFGLLLFLIYTSAIEDDFIPIHVFNIFSLVIFYFTINSQLSEPESVLTRNRLGFIVFFYSLFFVSAFNLISNIYNQNFFVFSEADALTYHYQSLIMASKSFTYGIRYWLGYYSTEDLGAVLIISTLYRIIESNLFLNFFYILLGVITAFGIFSISKNLMSVKYAFLCALTYSISSFVLWFHASGLKESFMVMLVVFFFDQYYKYINKPGIRRLVYAGVFLTPLMLFRPAVLFLCLGAVLISFFLRRKLNLSSFVAILLLLSAIVFSSSYIKHTSERFVPGGVKQMIRNKTASTMVKGSLRFRYSVNIMAAAIGPLPTLLPNKKTMLSFYSVGLIYRVFISLTLWFGIYYAYKKRVTDVYPLILFALMEMASLVFILEGLELRKSLPHFPAVFIVSFWFLDTYNSTTIIKSQSKLRLKKVINLSIIFFFFLIMLWNKRLI